MLIVGIDPGVTACGISVITLDKKIRKCLLFLENYSDDRLKAVKDATSGLFLPVVGCLEVISTYGGENEGDILTAITRYVQTSPLFNNKIEVTIIEKGIFVGYGNEVLLASGWLGNLFFMKGSPVVFVNPSTVKKVITGKGRATKAEIKKAVRRHLELSVDDDFTSPQSTHIWDSLMYALYGLTLLRK